MEFIYGLMITAPFVLAFLGTSVAIHSTVIFNESRQYLSHHSWYHSPTLMNTFSSKVNSRLQKEVFDASVVYLDQLKPSYTDSDFTKFKKINQIIHTLSLDKSHSFSYELGELVSPLKDVVKAESSLYSQPRVEWSKQYYSILQTIITLYINSGKKEFNSYVWESYKEDWKKVSQKAVSFKAKTVNNTRKGITVVKERNQIRGTKTWW